MNLVSGTMLTLLLTSMVTLVFDVQAITNLASPAPVGLANSFVLELDFSPPIVTAGPFYDSLMMSGLPKFGAPGEPILPFKMVKALIPQGNDVQSIEVTTSNRIVLKGRFNVECGKTPIPISSNITVVDQPKQAIYNSANPFPGVLFSQMLEQRLRGYKILLLKLHPVQYIPKTGELYYFETITVTINMHAIHACMISSNISPLFRILQRDKEHVLGFVDNPSEVESYTETTKLVQHASLVDSSDSYEYVIITNSALRHSFQPLINWKIQKGLNATIVLVKDILNDPDYHCDGLFGDGYGTQFNDTQAHIRNFIKDAYINWETEYVLLGGDDEIIPARGVYVYEGDDTDVYEDYEVPCDMYYGALDGSWDSDNDTIFGEAVYYWNGPENGTAGEEADFLAEVYIGRATVDTAEEASNFVSKTLAYEQNHNSGYLKKALMIGETFDDETEGGNGKDLVTDIIPEFTTRRLYDRDGTFSRTAVINEMNSGTHLVNHYAHAWYTTVMGLNRSDVNSLINTEYFIAYSVACYSAAFDNKTSGTDEAIAEHFITSNGGAFAYIGNSRYGWYMSGSTDGPGARYDRSFFSVLKDGIRNVGKTLQLSKESLFDEYMHRWTYFTLNLLGDPEVEVVTNITVPTAHLETRTDLLTPPRYEGIVSLNGTAKRGPGAGVTFDNYTIEFGPGTNPLSWSSTGICLANNGRVEVVNSTLATWNSSLVSDGTYTLKLTVSDVDGNAGEDWAVIIVDNLCRVYVNPQYEERKCYENYTFEIKVASVEGLMMLEFKLRYDTNAFEFPPIVKEGPFLNSAGRSQTYFFVHEDLVYGYVHVGSILVKSYASGNGTLATITVIGTCPGEHLLEIYDTILIDINLSPINHTTEDGWLAVAIPGDCDGDHDVDSTDLLTLASAYGSEEGDPLYNSNCDFDGDNTVRSMDLFILAANYGKVL